MTVINLNSEKQKTNLMYLLQAVKSNYPELGSYIEHFHYTNDIIIVKLTNGFIKVNEPILLSNHSTKDGISADVLNKIGSSFIKTLL